MRALIALFTVLLLGHAAAATPAQQLDRGRASFRRGDWQSAIPVLNDLIYPDLRLARQEEAIEAHLLLGAAHYEIGNRVRAQREFTRALELDPERGITTLMFSEGAVRLFDETKRDFKIRLEAEAARKRLAEQADALRRYKESLRVVEARSYSVNFIPFGAGQFQNKHTTKGILFAAGQGITGGLSAGIFLYLAGKYGLVANVDVDQAAGVRRLQQIEVVAGSAFFALWAWSVIDALVYYKPRERIEADDSLLPDELKRELGTKPKPKKTSFRDRLRLGPIFMPDGVGIGLSLEND